VETKRAVASVPSDRLGNGVEVRSKKLAQISFARDRFVQAIPLL
jgi:hypothetical protein